jgi:hypothetical protein
VSRPHEYVGSGIGEQVSDLRWGQPEVDRHEDRAQFRGGEHRLQEGCTVEHQGGDTVSLANPQLAQGLCELICTAVKFGVRDTPVPVDQRDALSGKEGPSLRPAADPGHMFVQLNDHRRAFLRVNLLIMTYSMCSDFHLVITRKPTVD